MFEFKLPGADKKREQEEKAIALFRRSRRGRRANARYHATRQRKHSALVTRQNLQAAYDRDTAAAQQRILEAGESHPLFQNVLRGLVTKHHASLPAA